jgi:ABC-type branched-subunit amino acid transport system permease subunit
VRTSSRRRQSDASGDINPVGGRAGVAAWLASRWALGQGGGVIVAAMLVIINLVIVTWFGTGFIFTWLLIMPYIIAASGTNITVGWTGRLSFGHALFFAGGAYVAAKLATVHVFAGAVIIPLICGIAAAALSVPLSLAAHKRRGVYFSVLTLIVAQIVYSIVQNWSYVGGGSGLANVYVQNLGPISLAGTDAFAWYSVAWTILILVCVRVLYRSPFGLSCRAVREDGLRAETLGVPTSRVFTVSLAISAFITGIAGAILAYSETTVSPTLFYWTVSGTLVVMCLLGGRFSALGPAIGAFVYIFIQDQLFQNSASAADALVGGSFLLIVLVLPGGLVSIGERIRTIRASDGSSADPEPPDLMRELLAGGKR